jgi:two-component system response regulator AtoC
VGEIPLNLQPKILRVIQSGEVDRIGADRPVRVDVRIVAATNRNLEQMVAQRAFRQDLYYRLAVVPLRVPPLRERREDIPLLARHFLEKTMEKTGRPGLRLPPEAFALLDRYDWPGNVRELENVIERMAVLSRDDQLGVESLPENIRVADHSPAGRAFELPAEGVRLDELEKDLIRQALERCRGNRTRAALGLTRNTLLYRMQKHGLR